MQIAVTASIGIAIARQANQAEGLVKAADAALYRAKSEGRNRVVLDESAKDVGVTVRRLRG